MKRFFFDNYTKIKLLGLVAALAILFHLQVPDGFSRFYLQAYQRGQSDFQKAYKLEKKDPQRAMAHYEKALELGLDAKVRKTALWRLYYLYKDHGVYAKAVAVMGKLGSYPKMKKIRQKMVRQIQDHYHVSHSSASNFVLGLHYLHQENSRQQKSYIEPLAKAIQFSDANNLIYQDIQEALQQYQKRQEMAAILNQTRLKPWRIANLKTDLFIEENRLTQALSLLSNFAVAAESQTLSERNGSYMQSLIEPNAENEPPTSLHPSQVSEALAENAPSPVSVTEINAHNSESHSVVVHSLTSGRVSDDSSSLAERPESVNQASGLPHNEVMTSGASINSELTMNPDKEKLNKQEQLEWRYLYARILTKQNKARQAVLQLLAAAELGSARQATHFHSIAAFVLYKQGYKNEALELIEKSSNKKQILADANSKLLHLILLVELRQDDRAKQQLSLIAKTFNHENDSNKNQYANLLVDRARAVLR